MREDDLTRHSLRRRLHAALQEKELQLSELQKNYERSRIISEANNTLISRQRFYFVWAGLVTQFLAAPKTGRRDRNFQILVRI